MSDHDIRLTENKRLAQLLDFALEDQDAPTPPPSPDTNTPSPPPPKKEPAQQRPETRD